MQLDRNHLSERAKAAVIVAGLHGLLGYALITSLGESIVRQLGAELKVFEVRETPPPPPPAPIPARSRTEARAGAASPVSLKAQPTPIIAPPPVLETMSPVLAVPEPTPVPPGSDPDAGSSAREGPGTGAGGEGIGTGSGGQGDGTGGGGRRRAERVAGNLLDSDYPRSALRMGIEGTVKVRYTVTADGRATRCTILETSGFAELDQTTCRLIERRFRYRPALDASGGPVPQDELKTYDWWLPERHRQKRG